MDDLADVTGRTIEPGDLVAGAEHVYCVEAVLWTPAGSRCIPVLGRRIELTIVTR